MLIFNPPDFSQACVLDPNIKASPLLSWRGLWPLVAVGMYPFAPTLPSFVPPPRSSASIFALRHNPSSSRPNANGPVFLDIHQDPPFFCKRMQRTIYTFTQRKSSTASYGQGAARVGGCSVRIASPPPPPPPPELATIAIAVAAVHPSTVVSVSRSVGRSASSSGAARPQRVHAHLKQLLGEVALRFGGGGDMTVWRL